MSNVHSVFRMMNKRGAAQRKGEWSGGWNGAVASEMRTEHCTVLYHRVSERASSLATDGNLETLGIPNFDLVF